MVKLPARTRAAGALPAAGGRLLERGKSSATVQHWVDTTVTHFEATNPTDARQEAAYSRWFDQQASAVDGERGTSGGYSTGISKVLAIVPAHDRQMARRVALILV